MTNTDLSSKVSSRTFMYAAVLLPSFASEPKLADSVAVLLAKVFRRTCRKK